MRGGEAGRDTGKGKSKLPAVRLDLRTLGIMTWTEGRLLIEWVTQESRYLNNSYLEDRGTKQGSVIGETARQQGWGTFSHFYSLDNIHVFICIWICLQNGLPLSGLTIITEWPDVVTWCESSVILFVLNMRTSLSSHECQRSSQVSLRCSGQYQDNSHLSWAASFIHS